MDDSNFGDPEIYEKNVCYVECERIYAEAVIFINDRLVRLIDVIVKQWLELKYCDHSTICNEIKENVIATWLVRRRDDKEVITKNELSNPGDENLIEENEIAQIFRIDTDVFRLKTPLCQAFKEFNYLSQIDVDVFTKDISRFKTFEENKDDWIYEWNDRLPWVNEKPWTNDEEDAYCITGDLPGFIQEENLIRYEDYELYDTIKDSELKEEALIKKRILEESMNVMEESTDVEWDHDFPIDE
nr:hypothetical protein [Tanacetum cinerariifolium]